MFVLSVIFDLQATIPHDYLYALLAIPGDNVVNPIERIATIDKSKIKVDYNVSIAEVYGQLLQAFVDDLNSIKDRGWMLELAHKMGLLDEEAIDLLNSEQMRRECDTNFRLFEFKHLDSDCAINPKPRMREIGSGIHKARLPMEDRTTEIESWIDGYGHQADDTLEQRLGEWFRW